MSESTQQNDSNGVPLLDCPIGSQDDLGQALSWIEILLSLHESPPGEHWHIRSCAEEFLISQKRKRANTGRERTAVVGTLDGVVGDPHG